MDRVGSPRYPFPDRAPGIHPARRSSRELTTDIRLAAAFDVSVLISGPPERAVQIARTIADRDPRCATARFVVCNATSDDVLPAFERAASSRAAVLVVCEAHALSKTAQMKLMDLETAWLGSRRRGIRRIIATSSAPLLECVRQGTFDDRLFYVLNAIHIAISAV